MKTLLLWVLTITFLSLCVIALLSIDVYTAWVNSVPY